jgi:hypothetical protein
MNDLQAFIDACLGGPPRRITDADLPELTRTLALRDQLVRIAETNRQLDRIDNEMERVRGVLRRQVAEFNRLNLAEISGETGIAFDA